MTNKNDLLEQAARCRRLAYTMSDAADYLKLIEMAEELERKSESCELQHMPVHLQSPNRED